MKKILLFVFTLLFTNAANCEQSISESDLLGGWTTSFVISSADMGEPMPPGFSMELRYEGDLSFHPGKRINETGSATLIIKSEQQTLSLNFFAKSTGTYEIFGNSIVESYIDVRVTPLDDLTQQFVAENPGFEAMVSPVKGEVATFKIISLQRNRILLQDQDTSIRFKLTRR